MKKLLSCFIPLMIAASLCGCDEKTESDNHSQSNIKTVHIAAAEAMAKNNTVTVINTNPTTPTPNKTSTVTNSSVIKGLSVDASGNLVTTFANGTTQTITGLAGKDGAPGKDGRDGKNGRDGIDGAPGKDGAPGERGSDGSNGSDGVGIDSVYINDDGELIVKLTNGEESNAGNIVNMVSNKINNKPSNNESDENIPDYEKIGYTITDNQVYKNGNSFISNRKLELIEKTPYEGQEYKYKFAFDIIPDFIATFGTVSEFSNINGIKCGFYELSDVQPNILNSKILYKCFDAPIISFNNSELTLVVNESENNISE